MQSITESTPEVVAGAGGRERVRGKESEKLNEGGESGSIIMEFFVIYIFFYSLKSNTEI